MIDEGTYHYQLDWLRSALGKWRDVSHGIEGNIFFVKEVAPEVFSHGWEDGHVAKNVSVMSAYEKCNALKNPDRFERIEIYEPYNPDAPVKSKVAADELMHWLTT